MYYIGERFRLVNLDIKSTAECYGFRIILRPSRITDAGFEPGCLQSSDSEWGLQHIHRGVSRSRLRHDFGLKIISDDADEIVSGYS